MAKGVPSACRREGTNAHYPLRLKRIRYGSQVLVTNLKKQRPFAGRQLVRCPVSPGAFHEYQGAVIDDDVLLKEFLWCAEATGE